MTLPDRIDRIRGTMNNKGWDLLVCALPMNVLMLSGYWPIVGTGVVCLDRDGSIRLLVPRDEEDLARKGWADEVSVFEPTSLADLAPAAQAIQEPLRRMVGRNPSRIAYEGREASEPSS